MSQDEDDRSSPADGALNPKRLRTLTLAAAMIGVVTVATASPAGASHWVYLDGIGDGGRNTAAADRNNDGSYDIAYTNVDYNQTWDIAQYDEDYNGAFEWTWVGVAGGGQVWLHDHNGDGRQEHGYLDLDGNGRYETEKWDGDGDNVYEWVKVDYTGDGVADAWVSGIPTTPSTRTDAQIANDTMVQNIVMLSQLRQCWQPGRC